MILSSDELIKNGTFNLNKNIESTQQECEKNQTIIKAIWSYLVDDALPLLLIKDYEKEKINDLSLYSDKFLFIYAASKYMKKSKMDVTAVTISDAITLGKSLCQYAEDELFPPSVVNLFWLPALFNYIKFSKNVDIISRDITTEFKMTLIKKLFIYHNFFIKNDIGALVGNFNDALSRYKNNEEIKSAGVFSSCQGIVSADELAQLGSDEYSPKCVRNMLHNEAKDIFMRNIERIAEKFKEMDKYLVFEAIKNLPDYDLFFMSSFGARVYHVSALIAAGKYPFQINSDPAISYFIVENNPHPSRLFSLKKIDNGTYIAVYLYDEDINYPIKSFTYGSINFVRTIKNKIINSDVIEMPELIADYFSNEHMKQFSNMLYTKGYIESPREKVMNILSYILPFYNCITEKNIGSKIVSCTLDVATLVPVVGHLGKVSLSLVKLGVKIAAKSAAKKIAVKAAQSAVKKNSVNLIKSSIQAIDPGFELGYGVLYNTALIGKKGTKKLIKLIRNNDYFNEREPLIKIINVNKIKPSIYKDFHLLKKNNQKNIPNAEYKKNEEIQYMMLRRPNEHMRIIEPEHPRLANVNYNIMEHMILLRSEFRAKALDERRRMVPGAEDIFLKNEDWLFDENLLTLLKNSEKEYASKAITINNSNKFLNSLFIDVNANQRLLGQGENMQRTIIDSVRSHYFMDAADFTNNPSFRRAAGNGDVNYNLLSADPDILFHRCSLPASQALRNQYPILNNLYGMVENQIEVAHQSINQAFNNIVSMSSKIHASHYLYTASPKSYLETYLKKVLQTNDKNILDQAVTRIRLHALRIKQFFNNEDYKSKIILAVTNNARVTAEHQGTMAFIYANDYQKRIIIMLNNFYLNPDFTDLHLTLLHEASHIQSATQDFLVSPLTRSVGQADELMEEFNLALDNYDLKKYLSENYYEKQNNIEAIFFNDKFFREYQNEIGVSITDSEFIYKVRHDPMLKANIFMDNADFVAKILSDFSKKIRADRQFFPHVHQRSIADENPHMENMFFSWILSSEIDSPFIIS